MCGNSAACLVLKPLVLVLFVSFFIVSQISSVVDDNGSFDITPLR